MDDLIPTLQKYVAYRRNIDSESATPVATSSNSAAMTPMRSLQFEITPRTSTPLSLPAERIKPPQTGKEMLAHVAWLAEELMSAAQEKVNLAQAAHDYVRAIFLFLIAPSYLPPQISRQIQVLGQSTKEQEASIALGVRPGTQLAPIILPDVAPPSRWTKNIAGGLVLDDDEQEGTGKPPTALGLLVDEAEQPIKGPKTRKGKRSSAHATEGIGTGRTTTLKITLPAMYDNRLYCYCHKPSDGEASISPYDPPSRSPSGRWLHAIMRIAKING